MGQDREQVSNTNSNASRRVVDISFWTAHAGIVLGLILVPSASDDAPLGVSGVLAACLLIVGILSTLFYFFALGSLAHRMGRSAIIWGGLAFLFSPVGMWVSYYASFGLAPRGS